MATAAFECSSPSGEAGPSRSCVFYLCVPSVWAASYCNYLQLHPQVKITVSFHYAFFGEFLQVYQYLLSICHMPEACSEWRKLEKCNSKPGYRYAYVGWRIMPDDVQSLEQVFLLSEYNLTETGSIITVPLHMHTKEKQICHFRTTLRKWLSKLVSNFKHLASHLCLKANIPRARVALLVSKTLKTHKDPESTNAVSWRGDWVHGDVS